jgi:hypothetical protein
MGMSREEIDALLKAGEKPATLSRKSWEEKLAQNMIEEIDRGIQNAGLFTSKEKLCQNS